MRPLRVRRAAMGGLLMTVIVAAAVSAMSREPLLAFAEVGAAGLAGVALVVKVATASDPPAKWGPRGSKPPDPP
jgi:hypothetical protein